MTTKSYNYILTIGLLWMTSILIGQESTVDVSLLSTDVKDCYHIAIKTSDADEISVAGQNYRIFYDADKLDFTEEQLTYDFDPRAYGRVYVHHQETDGIGFLSISLDGRKLTEKTISLPAQGTWTKVAHLCFTPSSDTPYDLTWAHRTRTAKFASAEVAISEWESPTSQQAVQINEIKDISTATEAEEMSEIPIVKVYPNPVIDYVNIELLEDEREMYQLIIKDIIGREVVFDHLSGGQSASYDLINWPEGAYTIELYNNTTEKVKTQKLIKVSQ